MLSMLRRKIGFFGMLFGQHQGGHAPSSLWVSFRSSKLSLDSHSEKKIFIRKSCLPKVMQHRHNTTQGEEMMFRFRQPLMVLLFWVPMALFR